MADDVRLFVDPGHGGKDPGAVSGGLAEKDSNLRIARLVEKSAKRQGWDVKLSRNSDVFVPLTERPRKAKAFKATSFVSVHSNSTGKKALGNMTIYRSKSGKRLGANIMRELKPLTDHKDIGNRRDVRGLVVLKKAKTPATLVEVLSVSTPKERKMLKDPKFQKAAAEAIVKGVAKHEGVKYVPPAKAAPAKPSSPVVPAGIKTQPKAEKPKPDAKAATKADDSKPAPKSKPAEKDARAQSGDADTGSRVAADSGSPKVVAPDAGTPKPAREAGGWFGRLLRTLSL
jgi:N-acetylmuramoyl-L-alanine amidase